MQSNEILQNVERVQVGIVGVDGARIMICDPGYIEGERLYERDQELADQQLHDLAGLMGSRDVEAVQAAYPLHYKIPYLLGHEGAAVVVRSGVGDGAYPVYATIADVEGMGRRVVRLEVDFLEHPWLATVPLEIPDAHLKFMERLQAWLPTVEGPQAQDLLRQVNGILDHYKKGRAERRIMRPWGGDMNKQPAWDKDAHEPFVWGASAYCSSCSEKKAGIDWVLWPCEVVILATSKVQRSESLAWTAREASS